MGWVYTLPTGYTWPSYNSKSNRGYHAYVSLVIKSNGNESSCMTLLRMHSLHNLETEVGEAAKIRRTISKISL
jgi:hypothetical protein